MGKELEKKVEETSTDLADQSEKIEKTINAQTKIYNLNNKRISGLMKLGYDIDLIAKTLDLHPETVRLKVRDLEKRDLTSSEFVDLAEQAVKFNLAKGDLKAAKMVYDRVHPKAPEVVMQKGSNSPVSVHLTLDVSRLKGSDSRKIVDADDFDDRAVIIEGERL